MITNVKIVDKIECKNHKIKENIDIEISENSTGIDFKKSISKAFEKCCNTTICIKNNYYIYLIDNNGNYRVIRDSYSLKKFLSNFGYDIKNLKVCLYCLCGFGQTIYRNEKYKIELRVKDHGEPHVHIRTANASYRINLLKMEQEQDDKLLLSHEFNKKEIKKIVNSINEKRELLIKAFNCALKGEDVSNYFEPNSINYIGIK